MTIPNKKNDTSLRVLEILKILCEKSVCIDELIRISEEKVKNRQTVGYETFLKYFSTLETAGTTIVRKNGKYELITLPIQIDLTEDEIKLFAELIKVFNGSCMNRYRKDFEDFIYEFKKCLKPKTLQKFCEHIEKAETRDCKADIYKVAETYEKYIADAQKLKIKYKNKIVICQPKDIKIENDKLYFTVHEPAAMRNKKLLTDFITSIEVLPSKISHVNITETVIFEVTGMLAENYKLRPHEKAEPKSDGSLMIINSDEDKDELMKRILRYGTNCRILSPNHIKNEYTEIVKRIREKHTRGNR